MKVCCSIAIFTVILVSMSCRTPPPIDLGPQTIVFDPSMSRQDIQKAIDKVYSVQQFNQFGPQRTLIAFLPGRYSELDLRVGFYTQIVGLGESPDDVVLEGTIRSEAYLSSDNATCNFWRCVEGVTILPKSGELQWAVSQATGLRRVHVRGDVRLDQRGGWSSGGWMSDVKVDGSVNSGSQQQWISRNCEFGSWFGSNWNMVFVGVEGAPNPSWPSPPYTVVSEVPVVREKPYLAIDGQGVWSIRVPALRTRTSGTTWSGQKPNERRISLDDVFVAHADRDTAATINDALSSGKNVLLTPGIYDLEETLLVQQANAVVLGLGYATLRPVKGQSALSIANVEGVTVSGILFDAGETNSEVLVRVGAESERRDHSLNPIVLHDVYFRVGGAAVGRASTGLEINASDVVVDHTWIWRADHGLSGTVGWDVNTCETGLVVNGENVTAYGLFVEHFQRHQVVWNGNGGRVFFYQSELPYDPPNQRAWTSANGLDGWASYKVADAVTTHEARGLGIYSVFTWPDVWLSSAIEVPERPGVRISHAITVAIGPNGGIRNVVNASGDPTVANVAFTPKLANFP